ncbi:MAG: TRAP transporter small permease subunit [Proteobacteria bacterium]|nr:TRAP transporter small permease subunit [Pseudomonadota bacterium]
MISFVLLRQGTMTDTIPLQLGRRGSMALKIIIERTASGIVYAVERLLALGLIVAIVFNFLNIVGRYTGSFTLLGVDEIEIDLLVWIAFFGAIAVTWRSRQLRMDVLYQGSPPVLRKAIAAGEFAVTLVITGFVAFESFAYTKKLHSLAVVSDIARIPVWIPNMAIGICFGAMAMVAAFRFYQCVVGADQEAP